VLNDEHPANAAGFPYAQILPIPGRHLVEHHIPRDQPLASTWIVEPIGLAAILIAQEHHDVLLSSSLVRFGFVFLTWPMHSNVPRKETSGLRPNQTSNGVMPFRLFVGTRLRMNTAVLTTSP
jgi:hypothetical protein